MILFKSLSLIKLLFKKLFKLVLFFYGFNLLAVGSLVFYFSYDIIIPSFKDANVTVMDLFSKDLDDDKYDKLVYTVISRSTDEDGLKLSIADWRTH